MAETSASASGALDAFTASPTLGLATAPPVARFILRGREPALAAAESVLGFALPRVACRSASGGERHALWLGPDEWLLLAPLQTAGQFATSLDAAMAEAPHALVEVSQRQTALTLSGPRASLVLSAACPLDLDLTAFPVGMCTRTLLGKAEIVLWRRNALSFHIEVWRSFSAYVWRLLEAAGEDLG